MEENHNRIQDYLEGLMSADESRKFEQDLKQDKELRQEYKLFTEVEQELGNTELDDFKDVLQQTIHKEKEEKTATVVSMPPRNYRRLFAIAASVLFLIGAFFWLDQVKKEQERQEYANLAKEYFLIYPKIDVRGGKDSTALLAFYEAYEKGDFYEAKNIYHPKLDVPDFYLGVVELGLNQPEDALSFFDKASLADSSIPSNVLGGDNTTSRENKLNYYIALSYLAKGEKENAVKYLQAINPIDQKLYSNAQDILLKLGAIKGTIIESKDSN